MLPTSRYRFDYIYSCLYLLCKNIILSLDQTFATTCTLECKTSFSYHIFASPYIEGTFSMPLYKMYCFGMAHTNMWKYSKTEIILDSSNIYFFNGWLWVCLKDIAHTTCWFNSNEAYLSGTYSHKIQSNCKALWA